MYMYRCDSLMRQSMLFFLAWTSETLRPLLKGISSSIFSVLAPLLGPKSLSQRLCLSTHNSLFDTILFKNPVVESHTKKERTKEASLLVSSWSNAGSRNVLIESLVVPFHVADINDTKIRWQKEGAGGGLLATCLYFPCCEFYLSDASARHVTTLTFQRKLKKKHTMFRWSSCEWHVPHI